MNNLHYSSIFVCKNGSKIPLLKSGRSIESKYNPENSAETILQTVNKNCSFFIVLGIGSGILLKKILEKTSAQKIIAVEYNSDDILFLKQNFPYLESSQNVIFSDIENLENVILKNYLPAIYGNLEIIPQKMWLLEEDNLNIRINSIIQESLKKISADYSVQCHFGKIWQKNILNNLKLSSKKFSQLTIENSQNKTAAIIAAGPSLENSIQKIKENRENYVIFSTDTAYPVLLKNKIMSNYVISIDGQYLSYNHFLNFDKNHKTVFLFDLTGNFSAARNIINHDFPLYYFISGHPFCNFLNSKLNLKLNYINSGSGTVTISALDIALKSGFQNIEIFGADFCYSNGKSYVKGTYLDRIYALQSNKINEIETFFDKLLFRTELINKTKNTFTTEVLNSYKNSLEEYLVQNRCTFEKTNFIYKIKNPMNNKLTFYSVPENLKQIYETISKTPLEELKTPLLPFIANLKYKKSEYFSKNQINMEETLKLARQIVVSYN
jgi:hypothetical protein